MGAFRCACLDVVVVGCWLWVSVGEVDVEKKKREEERRSKGLSTHRQSRLLALWPEGDKDSIVLKVLFAYVEAIVPSFHP